MTITTKTAKNGVMMYYVDGKRISRDKAIEISKNADVDMLTNALGANVELKDAQAILAIATKDPLEAGKYREFGWCFTNVIDAVEAAKKVAALFGDRFTGARIMGDAEHFDNRIIATVDKAGNVEIKKQTPEYIFTAYQTVTGVDCNGRTEHVESFATTCKELGDDDNFTGLYRAVTFYEDWHYNAWDIKTADGKLIAKGNTKAELKKAYEAIKAGNVEVSEEIAEDDAGEEIADITDAETAEVIPVERFWCEVEIAGLSEQDAADIVAHFHGQDGANKFFKMRTTELDGSEEDIDGDNAFDYLPALDELNDVDIDEDAPEAFNAATEAEEYNARVASGNYYADINGEFVTFKNNSIVHIYALDKRYINANYIKTAKGKKFYNENRDIPAEEIIDSYMSRECADEDINPDEYIITQAAMDEAIEDAEVEALATKMDARILADPIIDAAYRKAKERVEVTFTKYGYPLYRYRKTNGEWTNNERVAKAYISKCGLSQLRFIVKAKHDKPADNTPAFTTKTDKNGKTLYYIDGKRRSYSDYIYQLNCRAELIDELPDKRMRWLNKPEDIYEDATTLESVSGIERDEHIDAEIADKYIAIDGATVQSVEVKQVGRSNSYYIDGKRASRDKALDACAEIRGDNLFTIEYQRERKTISRFDVKISMTDDGFSVISGQATIHTFEDIDDAVACVNQIEAAYLAGKAGVKVDSGGTVSDLDDRRTEKIGSDEVYYIGGKWQCTYSAKYHASFFRGIRSGELMYRVDDLKIVSEQEFWAAMIERGACTIDLTDAEELTAKLKEVTRKARLIEIYPQVGGRTVDNLHKVEIVPDGGGFIFTNVYETLARYDTKEQCLDVIERIKRAIDGCDTEFEFPTAELVDLEKKLPALMIEQFNKYRYRSKGRSIPRRFLAAQLKYYGLTPAQLKEAYHA